MERNVSASLTLTRIGGNTLHGRNAEKRLVIVKSAPSHQLENERKILRHFHDRPGFRQLIDEISDPSGPPLIVLGHLDDNILNACRSRSLQRSDIKPVAKEILKTLRELHSEAYVHTGMLQVNYSLGLGPSTDM